jgi:glycosyltransferase involved in cell wall biosynthesis
MKVGIDAFGCDHGRSGIGSHLRSLVANLPPDPHLQFELFGPEVDRYTYTSDRRDIAYRSLHTFGGILANNLWHQFSINSVLQRGKYDVALYPAASRLIPQSFKVPGVAIISDVLSTILKTDGDSMFKKQIRNGLSRVTQIIVSSQYVRKDLVNLSFDPGKIEVVYQGIDHSLFYPHGDSGSDEIVIKPFAVQRPYLIYASRIYGAAKRHIELVRAFSKFKRKTGLPHRLVLAGNDGDGSKPLQREAAASDFVSDILITGYFPTASLPLLYSNADACIFPATNEGGGLPVVEAMASGIPVACSRSGALPEITGSHAVYFDTDSVTDTALAIENIVTDTALREKLIKNGIEWTKRFSCKQTAEETVAVLKKAADH